MPASPAVPQRDHDVVVLGATGFTGELTAAYLAEHAPEGLRWALAGRNQEKLEAVRERLTAVDATLADLPLLQADSSDEASLAVLAASTRVVVTTVGPYLEHGAALVAACARAGTDYVDLTGEPEFVDRMYVEHHDESGRLRCAPGARLRLRLRSRTTSAPSTPCASCVTPCRSPCAASCARAGRSPVARSTRRWGR